MAGRRPVRDIEYACPVPWRPIPTFTERGAPEPGHPMYTLIRHPDDTLELRTHVPPADLPADTAARLLAHLRPLLLELDRASRPDRPGIRMRLRTSPELGRERPRRPERREDVPTG